VVDTKADGPLTPLTAALIEAAALQGQR
jgi:hypothetical protein